MINAVISPVYKRQTHRGKPNLIVLSDLCWCKGWDTASSCGLNRASHQGQRLHCQPTISVITEIKQEDEYCDNYVCGWHFLANEKGECYGTLTGIPATAFFWVSVKTARLYIEEEKSWLNVRLHCWKHFLLKLSMLKLDSYIVILGSFLRWWVAPHTHDPAK